MIRVYLYSFSSPFHITGPLLEGLPERTELDYESLRDVQVQSHRHCRKAGGVVTVRARHKGKAQEQARGESQEHS